MTSKSWDIPPGIGFHFGRDHAPPGGRYCSDVNGRITIFTQLAGSASVTIGDVIIGLKAGQSVMIDANRPYIYQSGPEAAQIVDWAESDPLPGRQDPPYHGRVFATTNRIEALHELACGTALHAPPVRADITRHLGHALAIECIDIAVRGHIAPASGRMVPKLERLLSQDLRREWTAPEMADALKLSQRTMTRRLKLEGDVNAIALLWKARIRQSVSLLTRSTLNNNDVAELCGFKNAFHFSRRVKQATGMTPTALREWASNCSLTERRDLIASL